MAHSTNKCVYIYMQICTHVDIAYFTCNTFKRSARCQSASCPDVLLGRCPLHVPICRMYVCLYTRWSQITTLKHVRTPMNAYYSTPRNHCWGLTSHLHHGGLIEAATLAVRAGLEKGDEPCRWDFNNSNVFGPHGFRAPGFWLLPEMRVMRNGMSPINTIRLDVSFKQIPKRFIPSFPAEHQQVLAGLFANSCREPQPEKKGERTKHTLASREQHPRSWQQLLPRKLVAVRVLPGKKDQPFCVVAKFQNQQGAAVLSPAWSETGGFCKNTVLENASYILPQKDDRSSCVCFPHNDPAPKQSDHHWEK